MHQLLSNYYQIFELLEIWRYYK